MHVPYSALGQGRREAFERFGSIHDLPIVRSPYGYLKRQYHGGMVLDVGAGVAHYLQGALDLADQHYHSLDTDPEGDFTFVNPTEIPPEQLYAWIALNQVLEHLSIEETAALLSDLCDHLAPGGRLVITVPNISHPTRWRVETHVTAWSYGGLYAMCQITGFTVLGIFRYSKKRRPTNPLSWAVERIVRGLYGIDWCQSIMLVATR